MPKPLYVPQPSSSVRNLLEPGVGRAALAGTTPEAAPAGATGETPDVKREFILTQTADDTLGHVVTLYSKATGTQVSNSHFLRALLKALAQVLPDLEREAWQLGRLRRPSNARGREAEREEYERTLAGALLRGLRTAPPAE
jgi:hypothetical protein